MKTTNQNLMALLAAGASGSMGNRRRRRACGSRLLCRVLPIALVTLSLQVGAAAVQYQVIHHFGATLPDGKDDGCYPQAGLVEGSDGRLYGTTPSGGPNAVGNVFRFYWIGQEYKYEVIKNFPAGFSGGSPITALLEGQDGALYGQTLNGSTNGYGSVFRLKANPATGEWSYSVLHSFANEAWGPYGALIGKKHNPEVFYGTTRYGGAAGRGTVFSLTDSVQNGVKFTVMASFAGTDGQEPFAALIEGSDGGLYGTTYLGGNHSQGTVFRIEDGEPPRSITVLHHFSSFSTDGDRLFAAVLEDSDGMLCGTTAYGGTNAVGIVFRMKKDGGEYKILRSFQTGDPNDGGYPWQAALVERRDGALMGVTSAGGTFGLGSHGTIFKLNKDGSGYRVLYSFRGGSADGRYPNATLVRARDGAYYGTTVYGGANGDKGTIFRVGARGDLDGDLDLDEQDQALFQAAYRVRGSSYIEDCDYNRSGRVNPGNYKTWYRFYKEAQQP